MIKKSTEEGVADLVLGLIVVDERVFLLKHKDNWYLPGGEVGEDEEILESITRVMLDDVGIKEEDFEYITLYEVNGSGGELLYRVHAFRIFRNFPLLINPTKDADDIYFALQDEALEMDLIDNVTRTIVECMYDS